MNLAVFETLENTINSLPIVRIVEKALDLQEDVLIELNVAQMQAGKDSNDQAIRRIGASYDGYAPSTIKQKIKKGQPYDRVTLSDTGNFQAGVKVKHYPDKVEMISIDEKSTELQQDYGPAILGIDPAGLNLIRSNMLPIMGDSVRSFIKTGEI